MLRLPALGSRSARTVCKLAAIFVTPVSEACQSPCTSTARRLIARGRVFRNAVTQILHDRSRNERRPWIRGGRARATHGLSRIWVRSNAKGQLDPWCNLHRYIGTTQLYAPPTFRM